MLTDYLEMSREAFRVATDYDNRESAARKDDDDELANYLLGQSKHYRHQSRKYLRLHENSLGE